MIAYKTQMFKYNIRKEDVTMNDNMFAEYPDVLTPENLQKILHIGRNTIYRYLSTGKIRSIRIGNQYRVPKPFLQEFLLGQTSGRSA